MIRNFFGVLLLLTLLSPLYSENIRGEVTALTEIVADEQTLEFRLYELAGITLDDNPFVTGLDLTLTIPDELLKYRDSFALNIYNSLDSVPSTDLKAYQGSLLYNMVLPVSRKLYISVPLQKNGIKETLPGSRITDICATDEFPLLFTVAPVMKGIPETVLRSVFKLTVTPVLSNKGILELKLEGISENSEYTILIDDKPVSVKENYMLESGLHTVAFEADGYSKISRSIVIEKGRSSSLKIEPVKFVPTVLFETPEGSQIYLDGSKIDLNDQAVEVESGEHVVRFVLGDYSLSKKFTVEGEKNYKISLLLDILVQDN